MNTAFEAINSTFFGFMVGGAILCAAALLGLAAWFIGWHQDNKRHDAWMEKYCKEHNLRY